MSFHRWKIIVGIRPNESSFKEGEGGGGGGDKGRLSSSQQFQFARKLKVTKKYWANCRMHARMRKKIEDNFLFKFG